jgi:hypothetical protein
MIPRARSDQLFQKNGNNAAAGNAAAQLMEEEETMVLFGPGSRSSLSRGSSVKKRQPANKEKTRRRNRVQYPEDNQFNKLMNMMIDRNTMQQREEEK